MISLGHISGVQERIYRKLLYKSAIIPTIKRKILVNTPINHKKTPLTSSKLRGYKLSNGPGEPGPCA